MTLDTVQQNALTAAWHQQRPLHEIATLLNLTTLQVREEASALQLPAGPITGAPRFSPDEKEAFREAWEADTANQLLASRFCLKLKHVNATAKAFGLRERPYIFTAAETEWIRHLQNEGHSRDVIAKVLGIARDALRSLPSIERISITRPVKEIPTHYGFRDDEAISTAVSLWGRVTHQMIAAALGINITQLTEAIRSVPRGTRQRLFPRMAYRNGRPALAVTTPAPANPRPTEVAVPTYTNPWWSDYWSVCSVADVFGFRYTTVMRAAEILGGSLTFAGTHLLALLGILVDGFRRGSRPTRKPRGKRLVKRTRPLHTLFQFGHVLTTCVATFPASTSRIPTDAFLERPVLRYQVREVASGDSCCMGNVVDVEINVLRTLARLRPATAWLVRGVVPARIRIVLSILG